MKAFVVILICLSFILGALSHERDIINSCMYLGEAKNSVWTADIKCEVIDEDEE